MSRIYMWWRYAKPAAAAEPGKVVIEWSSDGSSFLFTWKHIQSRKIDLVTLRNHVFNEGEELRSTLALLVPFMDASTFDLSLIHDNLGSTSLFDQGPNKAVFQPYISKLQEMLHTTHNVYDTHGQFVEKQAKGFLLRSQTILQNVMVHFCHTCGVPPRAWQVGGLLYRTAAHYERNLRLLQNEVVYIGNPKAKQRDKLVYESFWALPPHLGRILIFILGVIRPVEIELLRKLHIPTEEHQHFIFVQTQKQARLTPYAYTSTVVNKLLVASKTLSMEARAERHIFTTILEQRIIPESRSPMQSAVIHQGQHCAKTKETHYAIDHIQKATGLVAGSREWQLGVSHALHAFYGFVSVESGWHQDQNRNIDEEMQKNWLDALDVARRLVVREYKVADGNHLERMSRVSHLMRLKPFMTGNQVCTVST
jgi:hypothetical protein